MTANTTVIESPVSNRDARVVEPSPRTFNVQLPDAFDVYNQAVEVNVSKFTVPVAAVAATFQDSSIP